jgi:hypothetical protein
MVRVHVAGDDRRDAECLGKVAQVGVAARVATLIGALELDEEAVTAEGAGQPRGGVGVAYCDSVPRTA